VVTLKKKKHGKKAEGKATFVKGTDQGYLKVSFFGPFYGSYIVFELDHENYQYSLRLWARQILFMDSG